ncbi:zinc transporter [Monaibacterium marinum]|uniref:Zinc transporter n=1 Tax=Pontivivens marinum TaxID=1690039 RepID=A0A2C9CTT8_9RHOB|nr:zinc transporter ZntB [Monaibacterium marinum]SOH94648.1 zinc transporter [Monaibacterium marinum]
MTDFVLSSLILNGPDRGRSCARDEVDPLLDAETLLWAHLDADDDRTVAFLSRHLSHVDPVLHTALTAEDTRPRCAVSDDGALLLLRGVNLNEGAVPEDMISLRLWVDPRRVVSLRKRDLRAVADLQDLVRAGRGPDAPGAFLATLARLLTERMEPVLDELEDAVAAQEQAILDAPGPDLRREIAETRRRIIILRRYIAPQRDAMRALRDMDAPWLMAEDRRMLQETADRVMRHVEDLDMLRERAQVIRDELANVLSDRLNRNLYALAILSAVFLPLGFITGLLGVNVGGLPGVNTPWAFAVLCVSLVGMAVAIIWALRYRKWM